MSVSTTDECSCDECKPELQDKELRVIRVESTMQFKDIGAAASKLLPSHARYRYEAPIIYTLEDGTQIPSVLRDLTKPKLLKKLANETRWANEGIKFARYSKYPGEEGGWHFILKFKIGA